MGRPTAAEQYERLRRVALVYRQALADGGKVTEAVADAEGVARSTAEGLIYQARKRKLLPSTDPGRKRA
jgi:hypothetical protein